MAKYVGSLSLYYNFLIIKLQNDKEKDSEKQMNRIHPFLKKINDKCDWLPTVMGCQNVPFLLAFDHNGTESERGRIHNDK